jgi:peptidoglycan/xylan/chitin deacetylase (PgdA/CDA1 family)
MRERLMREARLARRERVRRAGAELYYGSLRTLRITALRRTRPDAGIVLCYHNVVADDGGANGEPGLHVPFDRFERQVRWLADHYTVVSLADFVRKQFTRMPRPLAAITFDDGYAGVFDHAVPLLRRLGIPATVFVVADAPGRSAGFWWDHPDVVRVATPGLRDRWLRDLRGDEDAILSEIQASRTAALPTAYRPADWATIHAHVDAGIEIGVHSATHRSLPTLTDAELEREMVVSRSVIHSRTGSWPKFFSYPYGVFDARVCRGVSNAGYQAAFGLERSVNGAPVNRWALPRMNVPSGISDRAFEAWTAGLH